MKKNLPITDQPQTKTIAVRRRPLSLEFPSINRFITESSLLRHTIFYSKIFLVSFVSGFLLINILLQAAIFSRNLLEIQSRAQARAKIANEIQYWKNVSQQYKDYRDVYFKLATLEYELGNIGESKQYMQKALQLDPNFGAGRVLGAKIGIQ